MSNSIPHAIRNLWLGDVLHISLVDTVKVFGDAKTKAQWQHRVQELKKGKYLANDIRFAKLPSGGNGKYYVTEVVDYQSVVYVVLCLRGDYALTYQELFARGLVNKIDIGVAREYLCSFLDEPTKPSTLTNRREIELGYPIPVIGFSDIVECFLFDIQDGKCVYCQKDIFDGYHIDHYMPLKPNGFELFHNPREAHNMVLACSHCNISKSNQHPLAWIERKFGKKSLGKICERVDFTRMTVTNEFYAEDK